MSGLGLVTKIEIDRRASDENINSYLERIGRDSTLVTDLVINPHSLNNLKKQLADASNFKIQMDETGITNFAKTVINETGEAITYMSKLNEKTKVWNQTVTVSQNTQKILEQEQKKLQKEKEAHYKELIDLKARQGQIDKELLTVNKKSGELLKEERKELNKAIRVKEKYIGKNGLEDSQLALKVSKQELANQKAIAMHKAKNLDKKGAQAYDSLMKSMEKELRYKKQLIGASEKDIELVNQKIQKEKSVQASARAILSRNELNTKEIDATVEKTKAMHKEELRITKEKHKQNELYKKVFKLTKQIKENELKSVGATSPKKQSDLDLKHQQLSTELQETQSQLQKAGLISQQKENELLEIAKDYEEKIADAQRESLRLQEEEKLNVQELINLKQRELKIKTDNFVARNVDYIEGEDLEKLQQLKQSIENLNGVTTKEVRKQVSLLELEIKELTSSANIKRIKDTSKELDSFQLVAQKITKLASIKIILQQLWEAFKVGTQYVRELDDAYSDIAISMDISRDKFNNWVKDARNLAQANGILTTDVMNMVKIYATAGESIEDIQEKLEGTAMIQNITQWDSNATTSAVNTVISQYKLLEKEIRGTTGNVANAVEYMGDVLVGISNELRVDNVAGIQEMVSAVETAGGVMEQSGASMEWYMALTGTLKETMNVTGQEVGNAFKMISARIFAQAEAMEELGESAEDIEVEALKAEKALNSVGVSIREAHDPSQLKDMQDIIEELAGKWDKLSEANQQYVATSVAGAHRRNYFISMMENYGRVTELTNAGLQAQGELAEANEVRVNSLAGRINILTDKLYALMDSVEPLIYGGVNFANTFVDSLTTIINLITDKFVPIMGIATGAVIAFEVATKGAFLTTKITSFFTGAMGAVKGFTGTVATAIGAVEGLTFATLAWKVALGGIIGGAIIGGIYAIAKAAENTSKKLKEMGNAVSERMESISNTEQEVESLTALANKYERINSTLQHAKEGSDLYKEAQANLLAVQQQIATITPQLTTYVDENGNAYATSKENLDKYIESQKELLAIEEKALAIEAEVNQDFVKQRIEDMEKARDKEIANLEEYAKMYAKLQQDMNNSSNEAHKFLIEKDLELLSDMQNNAIEKLKEYNQAIIEGEQTLAKYNAVLNGTKNEVEETDTVVQSASLGLETLATTLSSINEEMNDVSSSKVENVVEEYTNLAQKAKDIQNIINDINTNGLHLDALSDASEYMKKFGGDIGDTEAVVKHLNEQLQTTQNEAYKLYASLATNDTAYWESANANSTEYFNNNIKNTSEWANYQQSIYNQLMKLHTIMVETMGGQYNGYFETIAKSLQLDLENCKSSAEARVKIEEKAQLAITEMRESAIRAFVEEQNALNQSLQAQGLDGMTGAAPSPFTGASGQKFRDAVAQIKAWKDNAISAIQGIDALINTAPTFTNAIGSMSDKLSSASKEAEKLVDDLEDIADAYYEISNALKDVENALEQNQTEQGYADPQRLLELYEKEIELLKQKQDLLLENKVQAQEEAEAIKKYLQSQGFNFNGEDIENYSTKFESLRKWANSLKGDEKENAIAYVEALMEQVERYTELIKDEIPDITNEWMDMTNQIREAEKELAEAVTQAQKDIADAIENALSKRYNAIKKELEKEKALYEQQYEDEDYEDALNQEQRKLDEIQQQINDISRDTSLAGQLKLQQLRAEYEAQQKVIDDMIRDHQREEGSNRFDEEMDKLDEELEDKLSADNLANMVNQALVDGFVTIGDEVIELNSLMSDWLNETGDGLLAIGDHLREELIDQLIVAKGLLADMGITAIGTNNSNSNGRSIQLPQDSYDYNTSAMSHLTNTLARGGQPTQSINLGSLLNVEGNVTEDVLPKLESMVNRAKTDILNNLAKQLSYR